MSLKIDLLPEYVRLEKILKRAISGCIVGLGVVAAILAVLYQQRVLERQTALADLEGIKPRADEARKADTAATAATTAAAPQQSAIDFMTAAAASGPKRAALMHLIRQYISDEALVESMDISDGQTLKMVVTVKDPKRYAEFLLNLRRGADVNGGPLFKGLPTAAGVGGFANGAVPFIEPAPVVGGPPRVVILPIKAAVEGKLLNPVVLPPDPAGAPAAAPGAEGAPPAP